MTWICRKGFAQGRAGNAPYRREAGTAGSEDKAPGFPLAEKSAAKGPLDSNGVSCTNFPSDLAGNLTAFMAADLERNASPARPPVERTRRTVAARRKSAELEVEILPRQMPQAPFWLDGHFHNIGRQTPKRADMPIRKRDFGSFLRLDVQIGQDAGLAGMNHAGDGCLSQDGRTANNLGRQEPQTPDRQSWEILTPLTRAASRSTSPAFAWKVWPFTATVQVFAITLPPTQGASRDRCARSRLIERRDPHQSSGFDRNIELAARIEAALDFESPATTGRTSGPDNIGGPLALFGASGERWE